MIKRGINKNKMNMKKLCSKKAILLIISIFMGWTFIFFYSYSTSPYYHYYFGGDSAQFLTIGKEWAKGIVPYRDLFDHKGPYIFFVDMVGFLLTNNTVGVMVLQFMSMAFTLTAVFNMGLLYFDNCYFGFLCAISTLVAMTTNYAEGNSVEEWCIPFICFSMYGMMKYYFINRGKRHNALWALLYGFTAGICFLTRITNYIALCAMLIGIIVLLVLKREYVNLLANSLSYIVGAALSIVPFIIYFNAKRCLWDFLYATYYYNVEYAEKIKGIATAWSDSLTIKSLYQGYFIFFIIFFSAIFELCKKDYIMCMVFGLSGILEFVLFSSGASFFPYPLVCIGQVTILLGELISIKDIHESLLKNLSKSFAVVVVYLCIIFVTNVFTNIPDFKFISKVWSTDESWGWKSLVDEIPDDDRDSFVAYGPNDFKNVYLVTNTTCPYKYFVIQEWHALFSEKVANEIRDIYENGQAKWILISGETEHIQKALDKNYYIYDLKGDYILYHIK